MKLSSIKLRLDRKTLRREKHKIKKILFFLIPTLVIGLIILIAFVIMLIPALRQPLYISPLGTLGIQAMQSITDIESQTLEKLLKKNKISFQKITTLPDSSYKIRTPDEGEILISFKKDINQQISSLQFILSRLTMEGKQFTRLDLRYEKPVVKVREK